MIDDFLSVLVGVVVAIQVELLARWLAATRAARRSKAANLASQRLFFAVYTNAVQLIMRGGDASALDAFTACDQPVLNGEAELLVLAARRAAVSDVQAYTEHVQRATAEHLHLSAYLSRNPNLN